MRTTGPAARRPPPWEATARPRRRRCQHARVFEAHGAMLSAPTCVGMRSDAEGHRQRSPLGPQPCSRRRDAQPLADRAERILRTAPAGTHVDRAGAAASGKPAFRRSPESVPRSSRSGAPETATATASAEREHGQRTPAPVNPADRPRLALRSRRHGDGARCAPGRWDRARTACLSTRVSGVRARCRSATVICPRELHPGSVWGSPRECGLRGATQRFVASAD
jgi:hypothetical protein